MRMPHGGILAQLALAMQRWTRVRRYSILGRHFDSHIHVSRHHVAFKDATFFSLRVGIAWQRLCEISAGLSSLSPRWWKGCLGGVWLWSHGKRWPDVDAPWPANR